MATTEKLQFIIEAEDNTKKALNSVQSGIESVQKKVEDLQPAFQKMAAIGTAGLVAVGAVAYKAVTAFAEVERSQRQLENAIINVSKGTASQVAEVNKLTSALQKKAGIDADSLNMGVAQLSTFGLQSKSVINLTKSLADLTVNQNGLNATSDQYINSANIIAKALRGEFGMLQKMGIRFTEAQQQVIKFGSEQEKVAMIQQGFAQNLRETTDTVGGLDLSMAKITRTVEDINEGIGQALAPALEKILSVIQPVIENILTWATENPKLTATIIAITAGLSALLVVVGLLGMALPVVMSGFLAVTSPIGLVVIAIAGISAGIIYLVSNFDKVKQKASEVWDKISEVWDSMKSFISTKIDEIKIKLQEFWDTWGNVITGIVGFITGLYLPKIALMAFTTGVELAKMVASWVVNTASIVAQIAIQTVTAIPGLIMQYGAMAFTALTTGATVVGQWVLMAGTAMLQAVQMAAAWLIAFGPIAIITGVVIALVALIVKNWTLVKTTTIEVFTAIGEFFTELWDGIVNKTKAFIDKIKNFLQPIVDMINSVIDGLQRIGQGVGGKIKNLFGGGKNKSVNDAIISPNGNIITTHPDDYIMAMKDPSLLAGGAGGINITITGNSFMGKEDIAEQIGNDIMKIVKQNMKL